MLLGVYGFVFSERTAINTVLPISNPVPIYVPQTPTPAPTDVSVSLTGPYTWDGVIGHLLSVKCQACHSSGTVSKGLDLTSFASAMIGSSDGPVIIPGDATNSKLIQTQEKGSHPGQLSSAEIQAEISIYQ
jgi:di/tricarboxylate transporter